LADNPLLPKDRLRELHALMLRIRKLEQRRPHHSAREAMLAATLLHLSAGDLLSGPAGDLTVVQLAPSSRSSAEQHELPSNLRLPLCAGAARGMASAAPGSIALAITEAGAPEPGWADALAWAHRDQLPLLLLCCDATAGGGRPQRSRSANTSLLTWGAVSRLARKLQLPLFPVDGNDAVAVFRVMQEATSRARAHGGPSIIWAVMYAGRARLSQQPLSRLEAYLAARNIRLRS
jgi:pyruvate dehydrogenase E1 component alpha subunit